MIDIKKILEEIQSIELYKTEREKSIRKFRGMQIPLQESKNELVYDENSHLIGSEKDIKEFIYDLPYTNSILKKHNIFRARLLTLPPKSCYIYHKDPTQRFHIPLITHPYCFFIIEEEVYHFPADGTYNIVDTTKMHTAVNASEINRYHIVGCL